MKVTKADLEQRLLSAEVALRNMDTPKPYKLFFRKEFYDVVDSSYWVEYKKDHSDAILCFFDDNNMFEFIDGGLVKYDRARN